MKKIKRYNRIYRRTPWFLQLRVLIPAVLIMGCVLLLIVSLSGPVSDFLSGKFKEQSSISHQSQSDGAPSSGGDSGDSSASAPIVSKPEPAAVDDLVAVAMPRSVVQNGTADAFLASAKAAGANACVIELKDSTGMIYFKVDNAIATKAGNIAINPIDIASLTKQIKEAGLRPVAQIHAFRDYNSFRGSPDAYVRYAPNPDMSWLDNSKEAGGKPWLNPYSEIAQGYILDIASQAVDQGFDYIVLDSVQFPTAASGLSAAWFTNDVTKTKAQVLSEFVEKVREMSAQNGAALIVNVTGQGALDISNEQYGGNPLETGAHAYMVDIMPGNMGRNVVVNAQTFENPSYDVYRFYEAALAQLTASHSGVTLIPYVDAKTGNTQEQISGYTSLLQKAGMESCYLYNPEGNY